MARKFNQSDPTANKAIANADKARQSSPKRRLADEFPEIFDDLSERVAWAVATSALEKAGGNAWHITAEHLVAARAEVMG